MTRPRSSRTAAAAPCVAAALALLVHVGAGEVSAQPSPAASASASASLTPPAPALSVSAAAPASSTPTTLAAPPAPAASASASTAIAAPTPAVAEASRPAPPPSPRRALGVSASLGVRFQGVANPGFDPFSSNDLLATPTLGAGFEGLRSGRFSLVVAASWSWGATRSTVRGQGASLTLHRLGVGPEARYVVAPWLRVHARFEPQALYEGVALDVGATGSKLEGSDWAWAAEATAGAALKFAEAPGEQNVAFWAALDGGYALTGVSRASLERTGASTLVGPTLPERKLDGVVVRVTAAVTF